MIPGGEHLRTELKGLPIFSIKIHKSTLATMKVQVQGAVLLLRTKVLQVTDASY